MMKQKLFDLQKLFILSGILFSLIVYTGCQEEQGPIDIIGDGRTAVSKYDPAAAHDWFELTNQLNKNTPGFSPPVAARAVAYTAIAMYEAAVPGMPGYNSLKGQINEFNSLPKIGSDLAVHWGISINAAAASILREMYKNTSQENLDKIDNLEKYYLEKYSGDVPYQAAEKSKNFGRDIAAAVLEYSKSDGGHEGQYNNFPDKFTPPSGDGMWVPTPPLYAKALLPYWGNNRPFLLDDVDNCQPEAPTEFSNKKNSAFYNEALEVYEAVKKITPEQKVIAEFWSDDPGATYTPGGHSLSILLQVLRKEGTPLDASLEAYAKLGIAVSDAFISCWKCKYKFNLIRPVSYIREYIDKNWMPLLDTPPFPEYVSGHSVQSGAAAEILTRLFGSSYEFIDSTHINRTDIDGSPRRFSSFYDFAEEAAVSRLYGGIHYKSAIDRGLKQGLAIGKNVNSLKFRN